MRAAAVLLALAFVASALVVQGQRADAAGSGEDEESFFARIFGSWDPKAELEVVEVKTSRTKTGGYGDEIEADPGYVFHEVRVVVRNTGSVALPLSTWHFTAIDENGFDVPAEVSVAHHDFDGQPIRKGGARQGVLLFEMREDALVQALVWQGELAWARAEVPSGAYAEPADA